MTKPSVAIVGASSNRSKFGNKAVRAHLQEGYEVYPVNPKGGQIEGLPVSNSLQEVPVERLDRVSMYVPPEIGLEMLEEIAAKRPAEFWLNPGSESPELVQKAERLGLHTVQACSIRNLGIDPAELPT